MDRRKILLIAAAVVAALGTALVFVYVRGADTRAEQQYETVEVLRAVAIIEPGETIEDATTNGKVQLQSVVKDDVLPTAQTSTEGLAGTVALTRIYPGEQIITEKFGTTVAAQSSLTIPDGLQAISVNLTDPARVAGFVNPGSEVAIYYTATDPDTQLGFSRLVLQRVSVLGVGSTTPVSTTTTDETGASTTEQLPRTLLTVAVDESQAQKIFFAAANGELSFGLLTDKSVVAPDPGATFENLFK